VLRRLGKYEEAAKALSGVIKVKRNEFWVWAEAGRLHVHDDPDLALACFCRALECPADPEFLVKVRRELAELLAEREEFSQASLEIKAAADARLAQGWGLGRELEQLMGESWYEHEPASAEDSKRYYAAHSGEALTLCFDHVETRAANYVGKLLSPADPSRPDRKPRPRPRFAFLTVEGDSLSLLGPYARKVPWKPGDPLSLVTGKIEGQARELVIQVLPRPDGHAWDRTLPAAGVVVREGSPTRSPKVFAGSDIGEIHVDRDSGQPASLRVGDGVQMRLTKDAKTGITEAFAVTAGPLPNGDVKQQQGRLKRSRDGGFAFLDGVFVPPPVVRSVGEEVVEVTAVCVYSWNERKNEYSWRAIRIDPV
jgi:hypothetical protein